MPFTHPQTPWPYSRWIAHRGAGRLAPENTLAAFRLGAHHGYRMFECDAKLSRDGVPFLLHDDTLERTTNGTGTASEQEYAALAQLDAGGWHSPPFTGEPLPTLAQAAHFCRANGLLLNIEIKPTPGQEQETGRVVAQHAAELWRGAEVMPLLSSFQPQSLAAAQTTAPQLPRALLLGRWEPASLEQAQHLACIAVVCHYPLWNPELVEQVHRLGMRALSYTVNEPADADALWAMGTDGIITDRVDRFSPGD